MSGLIRGESEFYKGVCKVLSNRPWEPFALPGNAWQPYPLKELVGRLKANIFPSLAQSGKGALSLRRMLGKAI